MAATSSVTLASLNRAWRAPKPTWGATSQTDPKLLLVHTACRLLPLPQRCPINSDTGPIGPAHQVGDHAMGVQLGITLPAGAMHEPGDREALGGNPATHPLGLLAGHRRAL